MTQHPAQIAAPKSLFVGDEAMVRWYECRRKQAFATWTEAEEHAQLIMRETPVQNGHNLVIAAYECSHCGLSHVGKLIFRVGPQAWQRRVAQARKQWVHEHPEQLPPAQVAAPPSLLVDEFGLSPQDAPTNENGGPTT